MDAAPPQPGDFPLPAPPAVLAAPPAYAAAPPLFRELAAAADIADVGLTHGEFTSALNAIGAKYNHALPPGQTASADQQERFYRSLQLADLALAQACALGREPAWQLFLARFRAPLRQAAIGMTRSAPLGEELADSLYAELYGLSERDGQRRSPLAGYSGRGSLMGWLRSTLAQRHVDHHRRTHREAPLPDYETAAEAGAPFAAPPAAPQPTATELAHLPAALRRVFATLAPEDRFLLTAYFLDQQTLLAISRLLRVHEATVSRKLKRLTGEIQKQLLKQLQAGGLSRRAAEEALAADPRDLSVNLRTWLQASSTPTFQSKAATVQTQR